MSENMKSTHNNFCNYEITKAKSARFFSVLNKEQKIKGIKTANVSKAVLAIQLAELF